MCIKDFQGNLTKRKVMVIMIISQLKYNQETSSFLEFSTLVSRCEMGPFPARWACRKLQDP